MTYKEKLAILQKENQILKMKFAESEVAKSKLQEELNIVIELYTQLTQSLEANQYDSQH